MSELLVNTLAIASKCLRQITLASPTYSGHSDGHECPSCRNAHSGLRRIAKDIILDFATFRTATQSMHPAIFVVTGLVEK